MAADGKLPPIGQTFLVFVAQHVSPAQAVQRYVHRFHTQPRRTWQCGWYLYVGPVPTDRLEGGLQYVSAR